MLNETAASVIDQTEYQTYGGWATLVIGRFHHQIMKAEQRVRGGYAPEDVRQLRASLRRLRFALEVFAPAVRLPDDVNAEQVARFARALGRLRDHDILQGLLDRFAVPGIPDADRESALMLRAHVDRHRHRTIRRIIRMLDGRRYRTMMESIAEWLSTPRLTPIASHPMEMVLPDLLFPPLSRLWMHRGWLLPSPKGRPVESVADWEITMLHALRRRARRVRYLLDIFMPFYPPAISRFRDDLVAIQRDLGSIQDDSLLPAYLIEHFGRAAAARFPRPGAGRTEARNDWDRLRELHLRLEIRREIRQQLTRPTLPVELPKPLRRTARRIGRSYPPRRP